jgi:hypothetical protein
MNYKINGKPCLEFYFALVLDNIPIPLCVTEGRGRKHVFIFLDT